ncbi:MAG TPA: hypothetical protein VFJ16_03710 [Longimicrobium sp.]|nr:hypothetical protein [Longimicrobium sp.]
MTEPEEVIEEVRRVREQIADRFGNDVRKYGEYLDDYQKKFGDRLVLPPPRRKRDRPAA